MVRTRTTSWVVVLRLPLGSRDPLLIDPLQVATKKINYRAHGEVAALDDEAVPNCLRLGLLVVLLGRNFAAAATGFRKANGDRLFPALYFLAGTP